MVSEFVSTGAAAGSDDFDRPVYCLFGLPFDAVDMATAVRLVRGAADRRTPLFLSTPNLNFLIGCQRDAAFRDSVIHSELSVADGMPLVWLARLLRIPIPERVAGSGLFEALDEGNGHGNPLRVFFFGGPDGMAERACKRLASISSGVACAGFFSPGFGNVEAMSDALTLSTINASGADFLVVALGARKGQAWIERNRAKLDVPVISHLGAVVNFVAGSVSRAPTWMQRVGLEWLWRIKEEPSLWRRYWWDGWALLRLFFTNVVPHAVWIWTRRARSAKTASWHLPSPVGDSPLRIVIEGDMPDSMPEALREVFRRAASSHRDVVLDVNNVGNLSPAFLGLVLMLKKNTDASGKILSVQVSNRATRRQFCWNGVDYLLANHGRIA